MRYFFTLRIQIQIPQIGYNEIRPMGRTDEKAKRPVTRRSRLLVVQCARGALFRHTAADQHNLRYK